MEGPVVRVALGGSVSIPARYLDLKGTASLLSSLAGSTSAAVPSFELPFIVEGPWDDPLPMLRTYRAASSARDPHNSSSTRCAIGRPATRYARRSSG